MTEKVKKIKKTKRTISVVEKALSEHIQKLKDLKVTLKGTQASLVFEKWSVSRKIIEINRLKLKADALEKNLAAVETKHINKRWALFLAGVIIGIVIKALC